MTRDEASKKFIGIVGDQLRLEAYQREILAHVISGRPITLWRNPNSARSPRDEKDKEQNP